MCEKRSRGRFVPPSVEEVEAYCQERGNAVDPQLFVDHYTANGWKVGGKAPMKDWRASVRTWERNGIRTGYNAKKAPNDMVGQDFNASTDRIQRSSAWLDKFLAEQERD